MYPLLVIILLPIAVVNICVLLRAFLKPVIVFQGKYIKISINQNTDLTKNIDTEFSPLRRSACYNTCPQNQTNCPCIIVDHLYKVTIGGLYLQALEKEYKQLACEIHFFLFQVKLFIKGREIPDPEQEVLTRWEMLTIMIRHELAALFSLAVMVVFTLLEETLVSIQIYLLTKVNTPSRISYHFQMPTQMMSSTQSRERSMTL